MSYKGYDKWECYIPEIKIVTSNLKDLKTKLLSSLKESYINQATGVYDQIDYEITKISIKKIKKTEVKKYVD